MLAHVEWLAVTVDAHQACNYQNKRLRHEICIYSQARNWRMKQATVPDFVPVGATVI
jgi:hypothetical protein